jgi:hypothetical protein
MLRVGSAPAIAKDKKLMAGRERSGEPAACLQNRIRFRCEESTLERGTPFDHGE